MDPGSHPFDTCSAQCLVSASGLLMAPLQHSSWPLQVLMLALALVLVLVLVLAPAQPGWPEARGVLVCTSRSNACTCHAAPL